MNCSHEFVKDTWFNRCTLCDVECSDIQRKAYEQRLITDVNIGLEPRESLKEFANYLIDGDWVRETQSQEQIIRIAAKHGLLTITKDGDGNVMSYQKNEVLQ